ncbi:MAG: M48 family metallopeptidase [Bacteroidales bacterium]|nr:M48 family metallopeptidase [Bacteroidales bacterium]
MQDEIRYRVVFSRRRTISLIVSPDKGVVVRAPFMTSAASIHNFVREKEDWIRKHLQKFSGLTRLNSGKLCEDGELYFLKGKEIRLKLVESKQMYVRIHEDVLEAALSNTADRPLIRRMIDRFFLLHAREYLQLRFAELTGKYREMGFNPSGLVVKPLRSRWGSCSSHGKITLSSELVKLDPVYADYVIIHELCHLKHHNHGKEFYLLLGKLVPDYKAIRKEIRQYITK